MNIMQSEYIQAKSLRLHYIRKPAANKPTLLFLHGLTDNGGCWSPVIDALGDDYDIVALDARGHGLSDAPATGYSPNDHAADAAAFIQALGLNKPVVIGHSMGGAVGAVLASQHPELVSAFIAEDPAWFDPNPANTLEMRQQAANQWLDGMLKNKAQTDEEMIADQHKNQPRWSDAELRPWIVSKRQVNPQVLEYILHESFDWRSVVGAIQCPILLVTGAVERGVIITPEQARLAESLNVHLRVANVPDTGHNIRRDDFDGYMAAVRAFLHDVV